MFVDSIKINNLDCVVQSHTRGANSRLFNQEAPPLAWNAMLHCVRRSRQVPVLGQKSCPGWHTLCNISQHTGFYARFTK